MNVTEGLDFFVDERIKFGKKEDLAIDFNKAHEHL